MSEDLLPLLLLLFIRFKRECTSSETFQGYKLVWKLRFIKKDETQGDVVEVDKRKAMNKFGMYVSILWFIGFLALFGTVIFDVVK